MYCENCGERLDDDTRFCEYCGAEVSSFSEDESDPVKVAIPEEHSFTAGRPEKKNKPNVLVIAMIFFVAALAVTAAVLGFRILGENDKTEQPSRMKKTGPPADVVAEVQESSEEAPGETKNEYRTESSPAAAETTKESEKTTEPVTEPTPEETEPEKLQELEGALAGSPRDLYSEDDFIMAARPDGTYSFMYPEDYFYKAVYDEEGQGYELATSDGSVTLSFTEMDSPVQGDPYRCSNEICEALKGDFLEGEKCPYVHESKGVADDGYSRMIIGGPLAGDPSQAKYCCVASNDTTTYMLQVVYPTEDYIGIGVDFTQTGYLLDCLYRGWSLSGSTYAIRTYDQYLADDMGSKKPGES